MRRIACGALTLSLLIHTGWARALEPAKPAASASKPASSRQESSEPAKPAEESKPAKSKPEPKAAEPKPPERKSAPKAAAEQNSAAAAPAGSLPTVDAPQPIQGLDPKRGRGTRSIELGRVSESTRPNDAEPKGKATASAKDATRSAAKPT